jgi:hypothetical protein
MTVRPIAAELDPRARAVNHRVGSVMEQQGIRLRIGQVKHAIREGLIEASGQLLAASSSDKGALPHSGSRMPASFISFKLCRASTSSILLMANPT